MVCPPPHRQNPWIKKPYTGERKKGLSETQCNSNMNRNNMQRESETGQTRYQKDEYPLRLPGLQNGTPQAITATPNAPYRSGIGVLASLPPALTRFCSRASRSRWSLSLWLASVDRPDPAAAPSYEPDASMAALRPRFISR